jgi:hypothetical protein
MLCTKYRVEHEEMHKNAEQDWDEILLYLERFC